MEIKKITATHTGVLNIGGIELNVAVLKDGTRVITHSAVFKALGREARGNARLIGIPAFMDAKNLQPLVSWELKGMINKVEFIDEKGREQAGYNAEILPLVCDLYLKAREQGIIKMQSQLDTAQKAEILVRSLAKIGITALVDEVTGYEKDKTRDALQILLDKMLRVEFAIWAKTFPDEFYMHIFRLKGWEYNPDSVKRPGVVGKYTNDLIYDRLAPDILEELKTLNPKNDKGHRKQKHHQWLTEDVGHPKLREHLTGVIGVMRIASDGEWDNFYDMLEKAFPKKNGQLKILFEGYEYQTILSKKDKPVFSLHNKSLKKALDFNPNQDKKLKKKPTQPKLF